MTVCNSQLCLVLSKANPQNCTNQCSVSSRSNWFDGFSSLCSTLLWMWGVKLILFHTEHTVPMNFPHSVQLFCVARGLVPHWSHWFAGCAHSVFHSPPLGYSVVTLCYTLWENIPRRATVIAQCATCQKSNVVAYIWRKWQSGPTWEARIYANNGQQSGWIVLSMDICVLHNFSSSQTPT